MSVPEELLRILACPSCRERVVLVDAGLRCTGCGLIYPIRDGLPIMLVEEARREEADAK